MPSLPDPEVESFLESMEPGLILFIEDGKGGWTEATYIATNMQGLHGPIIKLKTEAGEERMVYPKILMDMQNKHEQDLRDEAAAA